MFEFFRKKKPPQFWSSRQLLLCYQLLCRAEQSEFKIRDFLFAFDYPQSIMSSDWEAFRMMYTLSQSEKLGIELKLILVNPVLLGLPQLFTDLAAVTDTALYTHLQHKSKQQKLLRLSRKEWLKFMEGESTEQLRVDGSGPLSLPDHGLHCRHILSLILPDFSSWQGKIVKATLKKALTNYLKEFKENSLIPAADRYFGYPFCKALLTIFLKKLNFRQGKHMRFQLGGGEHETNIRDEFTQAFKESFREEYVLWRKGTYVFPFFETLLSLELDGKIIIDHLQAITESTQAFHQQQFKQLHYYGAHRQPLQAIIELSWPEPKRKPATTQDQITDIRVVKSTTNTFFVCLNGNRLNHIILNKSSNSGHLLYTMAVNNGWANYDRFASGFHYIQKDKRFKLFAKTNFSRQPLLEVDDDGFIIPVNHLAIRLVDQL